MEKTAYKQCVVAGCPTHKTNSSYVTLFPFPTDDKLNKVWCNNLGITKQHALILRKPMHVCSLHFPKHFLASRSKKHILTSMSAVPVVISENLECSDDLNKTEAKTEMKYDEEIAKPNISEIIDPIDQSMNVKDKNNEVQSQAGPSNFKDLFSECGLNFKPTEQTGTETTAEPAKTIIAENLECSSADSFACGKDQNIFTTGFQYKNPVFLEMRISKYEADLKRVIEEQAPYEMKLHDQKAKNKMLINKTKTKKNKKLKEMAEFREIYDKPQMKIPKLIFERFMVDYENEECCEDLKQFAAEVNSRSSDAYDYIRKCFPNIFPPVDSLQLKVNGADSDTDDDNE